MALHKPNTNWEDDNESIGREYKDESWDHEDESIWRDYEDESEDESIGGELNDWFMRVFDN